MEGLRCSSLIPLNVPKSNIADCVVQGYKIPAGSFIFSNLYNLHNDPRYWENPQEFNPERFITADYEIKKNIPSFFPFSIGMIMNTVKLYHVNVSLAEHI